MILSLAQMVAECMDCSVDDVAVFGADTDASPYDSGSYASSTTYVTGKAVELACDKLKKKLCAIAAGMLGCEQDEMVFRKWQGISDRLTQIKAFHIGCI